MRILTANIRREIRKLVVRSAEILDIYLDPPYTIATYRWTNSNLALTFGGYKYSPVPWKRTPSSRSLTEEQDRLTFQLANIRLDMTKLILDKDISGGKIVLRKVYRNLLTSSEDYVELFTGLLGTPILDENLLTIDAVSPFSRLSSMAGPRRIYQIACAYTLGDTSCTVDLTTPANRQVSTAQSGSTKDYVQDTALAGLTTSVAGGTTIDLYWREGVIEFTSGDLAGQARPIHKYVSVENRVYPVWPFPKAPQLGDQYRITRGCRNNKIDCRSKFDNLVNYGGFAEVPIPPTLPAAAPSPILRG